MKKYYHGSFNELHVGQILIPTKDYINNWYDNIEKDLNFAPRKNKQRNSSTYYFL